MTLEEKYKVLLAENTQLHANLARITKEMSINTWREAVIEQCMLTECCYDPEDPKATVECVIDWHIRNERELSEEDARDGRASPCSLHGQDEDDIGGSSA